MNYKTNGHVSPTRPYPLQQSALHFRGALSRTETANKRTLMASASEASRAFCICAVVNTLTLCSLRTLERYFLPLRLALSIIFRSASKFSLFRRLAWFSSIVACRQRRGSPPGVKHKKRAGECGATRKELPPPFHHILFTELTIFFEAASASLGKSALHAVGHSLDV